MKRVALLTAFVLVAMVAALAPPETPTQAQANCFQQTGFCITNPQFAEYFRLRGDVRILGYPISRSFTLEGFEVQFFQRVVLQMQGGQVARLNVLDPGIMPMTRANQSVFPGPDPAIQGQAPQVGSPDYARQVVEFVRRVSPDTFSGQPVGFFNLFNTTVPVDVAFPGQTPNPDLVTLLNLEIWGLPTSNPAPDPGNGGFIYQRFQRGIMHFRAEVPVTEGILVGEYLKAVMTYRALPPDLAEDMASSRYRAQYSPGSPGWLARPADLPSTDLNGAFEPGTGSVNQPPPPTATPGATLTPTPTGTPNNAPTATIQVDDDTIDPGQSISVTVIGRGTNNLLLLQWQTVLGDENPDEERSPATDPQLAAQNFYCDQERNDCANIWTVAPTTPGRYTLWARAYDMASVPSEWTGTPLRIRAGNTPTATPTIAATPTATGTPAATPTPTGTATPTTVAGLAATTTPTRTR